MRLLSLPREVGAHPEDGKPITAGLGRYGPFVQHDGKYANLPDFEEVFSVGLNRAVDLLAAKAANGGRRGAARRQRSRSLGEHPDGGGEITVRDGRYGPYVNHGKINATLPKDVKPEDVTLEQALELIAAKAGVRRPAKARATAKRQSRRPDMAKAHRRHGQTATGAKAPPPSRKRRSRSTSGRSPARCRAARTFSKPSPSCRRPVPSAISPAISALPATCACRSRRCCREMEEEGLIARERKNLRRAAELPSVTVLDIPADADPEHMIAYPASWDEDDGERPAVEIVTPRGARVVPGPGNRILARIERGDGPVPSYTARADEDPRQAAPGRDRHRPARRRMAARLVPVDRKQKEMRIDTGDLGGAKDGDLVEVEVRVAGRLMLPKAKVTKIVGNPDSEGAVSLIALHNLEIPYKFPDIVLREAEAVEEAGLKGREDWRAHPLRHHRSRRRPRTTTTPSMPNRIRDPGQSGRPCRLRRHRRCRRLCAPRHGARPRSLSAGQFGLFPRPGGADAARTHLQRSVFAARRREPPCPGRAHGLRRQGAQAQPLLPPRHHPLGRQARLRARRRRRSTASRTM